MDVLLSLIFFFGVFIAIVVAAVGVGFIIMEKPSKRIFKRAGVIFTVAIISFFVLLVVQQPTQTTEPPAIQESEESTQEVAHSSSESETNYGSSESETSEENTEVSESSVSNDFPTETQQNEDTVEETKESETETLQPEDYATDITYEDVARNPDSYTEEPISMSGTIIQIMQGDVINQARVAINDDYNQIVLIEYYPGILEQNLLEDDYITFYGTFFGPHTYETVLGAQETIPAFMAPHITLN